MFVSDVLNTDYKNPAKNERRLATAALGNGRIFRRCVLVESGYRTLLNTFDLIIEPNNGAAFRVDPRPARENAASNFIVER